MKVFVDTNVLIDYLCKREPFFVPAKSVFALCYMGKIEIVISSLSIVNTIYIGRNHNSTKLKQSLLRLSHIVSFMDLSASMALDALQTEWEDYEDALQYATAQTSASDFIITRNKRDYSRSDLPVYTPEELLALQI
jgi:predicted nucleic acid-binding protein